MKAIIIKTHGGLEQIILDNVESPKITSNEVLIEPRFSALNHLDLFVAKGWSGLNLKFPHILGSDGAGIVKAIGSEVSTVKVGDRVTVNPGLSCGKCAMCLAGHQNLCKDFVILGEHVPGTFAEQFKIPEINVLKIPTDLGFDLAAAAPLVYLTAWRLLVTKAQIKPGDIVLIQGASGGVSTASIQIAKYFGSTVIATTSSDEKVKKIKALGADYVINYKEMPDYSKYVFKDLTDKKGVDVVLDSVGAATFSTSLRLLCPEGKLVTPGATTGAIAELDIRQIFWKQLQILGSTMSNQSEFRAVMNLIFQKKIIPVIDKVFPLSQARESESYLQTGAQCGKILLEISPKN
jgi:NADPH:quinone reductase-like Zn-dependent oxidoreductase